MIEPESDWFSKNKEDIEKICDRHYGIGSDGILFGPEWIEGTPMLRIFNPDGSEAEKSGNGLRIFAHHLFMNGHVKSDTFSIKTISGRVNVKVENKDATLISVEMGKASFEPKTIPLNHSDKWVDKEIQTDFGRHKLTCLSVGNPHAVFFPENWDEELIYKLGPHLENNALFPNRTNVQMVRVLDRENIEIKIWERGAGFTQASGSSSCAAAYAAFYLKKTSNKVNVKMPGGSIEILIDGGHSIHMKGKVGHVFNGTYSE